MTPGWSPMTPGGVHVGILLVAFATLVTMHLTLAAGLLRRAPWWRAPLALVVAPLAPWWGWGAKMRVRSTLWVAAAVIYVAALLALR
jgi:hypothetical protein